MLRSVCVFGCLGFCAYLQRLVHQFLQLTMSENEDTKLELSLGLPGDYHHQNHVWSSQNNNNISRERNSESLLSLSYNSTIFLHNYQTVPKEKVAEKKGSVHTVGSQKRAAPGPVVGWPPVRSCRKNLASTGSAKAITEPQNATTTKPLNEKPPVWNTHKGLFVKINMDGVPIGRKVDLKAYDSYEKLSSAVDELFRGLLAAQRDSTCDGMMNDKEEEQKAITGLLDGSGEYTLVYEDNEGDRMLVGDVPWPMFVSTVKRLRVLKSCELPTLSRGGSKQGKMGVDGASK